MNEEYLLQLYKYISDNDTSYKNDVSFDSFRSDMSDSQYASQIYGYLNDLDSTFSDDVSVIDFIKDINTDPKQIKKKDTVVDVTSPMEPMGSTLPQEDTSGLSESEELLETEADVANPFEGMSLFKETPDYLIDKDKQKELTDLENKKFVEDIEAQSNKIAESYADELDNDFYEQEEVVKLINEANRRSKNEVQAFVDNLVFSGIDPKTEESKKQIQDYYSLIFDRELSSDEKFNSLVSSYSDVRADKVFSRVKEYQSSAAKAKKAKDLMDNPIYETLSKIPVAKNLLDNYLLSDGLVGEASSAFMYGKPASKELVPVAEASIELKKDRARLAQMDADGVDELVEYLPAVGPGAPPSKIKFTRNQVLDRIQSSSDELASLSPDKISRALDLQKISQFLSPEDQFLEGDFTLESLGGLVGQQLANQVEVPILGTYALELGASYLDTVKEIAEYKYGEASPENIIKVIDSGEDGAADLSAAAQLSATIDAFGLIPIGKGVSVATKGAIKAGSKTASKTASETFKETIIGRVKKQIKENIKDKIKNKAARKFIDDSYQVVKGSLIAGFSEFPLETTQGLLVSEASRKTIEGATGQELETDIEGSLKEGGAAFIVSSAIPFTAGSVSISGRGARDVYKSSTKSLAEKARKKIQEKSKDYLVNESPKTRVEINEIIESAKTPEDLNGIFINNDKGLEDKLTSKYNQLKDAVQEQETGDVPITEQAEGVQEVETEVREPSIQEKRQKIEQRRQEELEPVMSAMADSEQTGEVPVVNGELVNKETLDDINAKYDVELDALQETRPIEETSKVSDALGSTVFIDNKKGTLKIDETEGAGKKVIFESEDGTQIRDIGDIDVVGNRPIGDLNLKQETGTVQEQTSPSVEGETVINTEGDVVTSPEGVQGGAQKPAAFLRERRDGSIVVKDERGLQRTIKGEKAQQFKMRFPDAKKGDQVRFQLPKFEVSKEGKGDPSISVRNKVIQEAAEKLKNGEISNEEYRATVSGNSPITPITRFFEPATDQQMERALGKKSDKLNDEIEAGTIVGSRLDIPAYKNNNTWVVSIHDGNTAGGNVLSYRNVAKLKNVNFGTFPKAALNIAAGKPKTTIARMFGEFVPYKGKTSEERANAAKDELKDIVNSDRWVQVGMNPFRHSYFYDRSKDMGRPINSASEVVQIGGLVYAKDPVYGNWTDESFIVKGLFDSKGEPVRFQLSEDLETTPQDVGKLKNLARKVEKVISQITEGISIIVPDTQQDYDNLIDSLSKSAEEKAMLKSANGFYDSSTKTAYINPSQATDTTIVHEAVHGLMSDALGSWKKADKVTNELWRTIRKNADNPELISQLEAFAEMYVQDGKMVQSSEAFSELMGILSSSEQTLNQTQRNAIQKFFDELMSFLGLKRMTVDETFELVDTLAARLASGDMITASDMAPLQRQTLVESIRNNNTVDNFIEATKTRLQGLFKMVYSEADRMKYLKDNGFLREVDNLSEFVGMDGTMVFPDDMLVGQGFLDGKQIFYGQGGLFFVTNTGDVWAVKGGANRIINSLNEQIDKQGKGYLFLVKGRSEKILNSAAGASNASKILIDFASKNLFSKADVKSSLFSAIKSVNDSKKVKELNKKVTLKEMGLSPNSSATEVLEGMKNYFDRNTTVSFDVRGTIIQNMLGNLVKSKNTNASKIIEILGGDPEYKLNKNATAQNPNGIIDLVSKLMSEDVLKGLKTQDVYAAVEVSSKVKEAKPDDAHKSYGTHIRTVDGSRPVLTLIKSTPNANKVFKKRTGKEITMAIGEDKSIVTVVDDGTRQQRAKTEIKKTLESSKDFEIFTTRNKIPMSRGLKGVLRNIKGLRSINLENVKVPLLKDPVSLVIGNPNVGISIGELLNYYRRSLLSAKKFFTKDLFRAGELKDAFIAKQASIVEQNISRLNRKMKEIKATSDDLVELDLFMRGLPNKLNEDLAPLATEMRSQIDKLSEILIANGWVAESREYVIEEISNDSGEYFAIDTGTGKRVKISQAQINQLESNGKAPMEGETVNILSSVKNNLGEYLTRSYKIFDDKNWKDKVGTVIVQRAKNLYREQLRSVAERVQPRATKDRMRSELLPEYTNDDGTIRDQELTQAIENEYSKLTPAQISEEINSTLEKMVDNKIDEILGTSEEKSFMKKGKMGSKDLSILKERNDIPLEIRMLMGEYTDPLQNYARTILKQSALVANQRFLETSRQMGLGKFFFESGQPRPRGFDFQIAAEGSETMSPLNGLYTTKEIFEQFSQAADSMPQWLEYWMKPISVVKWMKTIGSFTTHIKNFTGNFGFMAANGHWDLREMGGAYKIIKNDLLSKTNVELNEMMNEYIEAGLVKQSAGLNEIRAMFKDANFDEATERILSKKPSKLGKVKKFLEDVYGSTDDMFKIVAYENEMSRYSKAIYGKDKSQLTNAERDSLKSEVADIVKNTYPTYSRVPELIQMIRRFPAVGNFVSFQAESWRTAYNIINIASKEIKSDNPAIKKIGFQRLAGVVAYTSIKDAIVGYTSYSAGMGLSGLFGSLFNDDEEKEKDRALRRYVAEWSKNSDLIILESKDGDLRYIDVSASDPFGGIAKVFNAFSNGENIMDATLDGLYAAIEPFIGTDIATNTFLQIKNNDNGYGGRIYNPEDPNAFNKALDKVIKTFQPGTAASVRRFIDAENNLEEAAAQLLGLRTYTNDLNQSFTFKLTGEDGYRQRIRDAKSLSRERYDKNATLPEVLEGEERKKQALKLIYADLTQDFVAAIKLGASPLKLIAKMKDLGLSKEDIVNVIVSSSED